MGFGSEVTDYYRTTEQPVFTVFACNAASVGWFIEHANSIWKVGFSGIECMDYQQIKAALEIEAVEDMPDLFQKLRHIERGCLNALDKRSKKSK